MSALTAVVLAAAVIAVASMALYAFLRWLSLQAPNVDREALAAAQLELQRIGDELGKVKLAAGFRLQGK
jgi:hypothetical protein